MVINHTVILMDCEIIRNNADVVRVAVTFRDNAATVLIGSEVEWGYDGCTRLSSVINSTA